MPFRSDRLMFKVLKPDLFKVEISPGSTADTSASWDQKELDTSGGMPSKKILSYHATKAVEWARANEWISSADHANLMPRASFDSPPEPPQAAMVNWLEQESESRLAQGEPAICCPLQLSLSSKSQSHTRRRRCRQRASDPSAGHRHDATVRRA